MGNIRQDFEVIYTSGVVPAAETASDVLDVRGANGIQLSVDYLAGGYAGLKIRPQFSFGHVALDSNYEEIVPTASNQEWIDGQTAEWDATNNRAEFFDNTSYLTTHASGTLKKKLIAYDVPGCTAARFQVIGDTLTGDDAGTVQIRAARVSTHTLGRRLH